MKQTTDNTHSFRPRGSMRVPLRPMPTMEQIEQEMRLTEAGFYVVAAAANELASVAVFDAMDTLRRNGFHGNKEARKWATKCEKDIHSYETMMRIRLQDASRRMGTVADDGRDKYTLWLDTTDRVDEEMKPHMDRLYYAVKMVMDRYSTPHSETLARMWTAHIMLQFAIRQFDTIFSDQKSRTGISLRSAFASGCMTGQLKAWHHALEALDKQLCPKDAPDVVLDQDPAVRTGVRAIYNKLNDPDLYNRGAEYGISLNPEVVTVSGEDMKELQSTQY